MGMAADLIAKYQDFPGAQEIAKRLEKAMRAKGIIQDDEEGKQQPLTPEVAQQIAQKAVEEFLQSAQGQMAQLDMEMKKEELRKAKAESEEAEHKAELADLEVDKQAAMGAADILNSGKPDKPAQGNRQQSGNRPRKQKPKKGNNK
jgi:hypothetical protein